MQKNLHHIDTKLSNVTPPLPYGDGEFEAIISVSIFSHLTEASQDKFLAELHRVCRPDGRLFLTVHGQRALNRALTEPKIRTMLAIDEEPFQAALKEFSKDRHAFVLQHGHLTTTPKKHSIYQRFKDLLVGNEELLSEPYEYGITFIPENYLRKHWSNWFNIIEYKHGGIHDFQDIVVLSPKY